MQYDLKLQANGGQRIDVVGTFFKYKSGQGAIRVQTSKGAYIDLVPGQGIWGESFTSLNVTDRSGNANPGVLLAGNYDFRDQSIPGTVAVADGGALWTANLNCFIGTATSASAPAANNVAVLANPGGSLKNVVVKSVKYTNSSGNFVNLFLSNYVASGNTKAANKRGGGPASGAILEGNSFSDPTIAALGNPLVSYFDNVNGTPKDIIFQEPVIVPPGWGLIYRPGNVQGIVGSATFDFREELA